jgi:hypothetical protein
MNIYLRLLLVVFLGVFPICCRTTTFKMEIPKNAVDIYLECVTSEEGVCRAASLDTRLGAFLAPAEITAPEQTRRQFKGIDTSPNPNFINPFSAKRQIPAIQDCLARAFRGFCCRSDEKSCPR